MILQVHEEAVVEFGGKGRGAVIVEVGVEGPTPPQHAWGGVWVRWGEGRVCVCVGEGRKGRPCMGGGGGRGGLVCVYVCVCIYVCIGWCL